MNSIKERQKIASELVDERHFEADALFFASKFPAHPLRREISRCNDVNRRKLDSQILYILSSAVSREDIIRNREQNSIVADDKKKEVSPLQKSKEMLTLIKKVFKKKMNLRG